LFTEKLGNAEGEVSDALWQAVSSKIPAVSAAPAASLSGTIKLIAAIVIATAAAVGIYVTDRKEVQTAVVSNQTTTGSEEKVRAEDITEPMQPIEQQKQVETTSADAEFNQTVIPEGPDDRLTQESTGTQISNHIQTSENPFVMQPDDAVADDNGGVEKHTTDSNIADHSEALTEADATFNMVCIDKEMKQYFFMPALTDAAEYHWDFGDGETSDVMSPQHIYEQEGSYQVKLTIKNKSGSMTSQSRECEVIIPGKMNIPQNIIITPNGDGLNDIFDVMTYSEGIVFQKIQIRNTAGSIIFESDGSEMWSGLDMTGAQCPNGYYQYLVRGIDRNQEIREKRGMVYLQK
jgi:hypothetical protein